MRNPRTNSDELRRERQQDTPSWFVCSSKLPLAQDLRVMMARQWELSVSIIKSPQWQRMVGNDTPDPLCAWNRNQTNSNGNSTISA